MDFSFEEIPLWRNSLGLDSEFSKISEKSVVRLRQAFFAFRERAALLAGEIALTMPDFTVHNVTHLDALWRISDLICGLGYVLNPVECFVLGGAFLLHDLGMAIAAYPEGIAELQRSPAWSDALISILARQTGAEPTASEVAGASSDVRWEATVRVLRQRHAERAEHLVTVVWPGSANEHGRYLLADDELRNVFGPTIGKIAHSHWWSSTEVRDRLNYKLGVPPAFPQPWWVDPVKLACILRAADVCHIDAERAPSFLKDLRKPHGLSSVHWNFQGKIAQPVRIEDRLGYSAGPAFSIDEAAAWWLCKDTLDTIDGELRAVDSVLADTQRPRFAARRVAYLDDLEQLTRHIRTEGWIPVDTRIRVSNVPALVRRLGGDQLYGHTFKTHEMR